MVAQGVIIEEPVHTAGQWKRAPYLQSAEDPFWTLAEAYSVEGASTSNPTSFTTSANLEQTELVNPSSVLRLCIERGDFPYSECRFGAQASPPTVWAEWVDEILSEVLLKQILMGNGTYDAVAGLEYSEAGSSY